MLFPAIYLGMTAFVKHTHTTLKWPKGPFLISKNRLNPSISEVPFLFFKLSKIKSLLDETNSRLDVAGGKEDQ